MFPAKFRNPLSIVHHSSIFSVCVHAPEEKPGDQQSEGTLVSVNARLRTVVSLAVKSVLDNVWVSVTSGRCTQNLIFSKALKYFY